MLHDTGKVHFDLGLSSWTHSLPWFVSGDDVGAEMIADLDGVGHTA
jgi:hypothetical protein